MTANAHKASKVKAALHQAGWRLARVTSNGHYLYATPGGLQLVNLHGRRAADDYLRSYAQRDQRREARARKQGHHAG